MLPKNSKHYIIPVAKDLDLDEDLVTDVIDFYYKTLRKTLVDLKFFNVLVEDLGSFKIKEKEIPKLELKYKQHLKVLTKDTFTQMAIKRDVEQRLKKVIIIKELIAEEKIRKNNFYKNKKNDSEKS